MLRKPSLGSGQARQRIVVLTDFHSSQEQSQASSSATDRKEPRIAELWKVHHKSLLELFSFEREGVYYNTECLNCGKATKKDCPSRMVKHIRKCYWNKDARDQVLAEYEDMLKRRIATNTEEAARNAGTDRTGSINELVLSFIGKNALPYSVVNSTSFRALLNSLEPRYRVPSTWTFAYKLGPVRLRRYGQALHRELDSMEDFSFKRRAEHSSVCDYSPRWQVLPARSN